MYRRARAEGRKDEWMSMSMIRLSSCGAMRDALRGWLGLLLLVVGISSCLSQSHFSAHSLVGGRHPPDIQWQGTCRSTGSQSHWIKGAYRGSSEAECRLMQVVENYHRQGYGHCISHLCLETVCTGVVLSAALYRVTCSERLCVDKADFSFISVDSGILGGSIWQHCQRLHFDTFLEGGSGSCHYLGRLTVGDGSYPTSLSAVCWIFCHPHRPHRWNHTSTT